MEGKPVDGWHLLDEHLTTVAKLAGSFAAEFGSGEWLILRARGMMRGKIRVENKKIEINI